MTISYRRAFMCFIAACALAIATPGCTQDAADDGANGDTTVTVNGDNAGADNLAKAQLFYDEVLTKGNIAMIDSLVAPDFVDKTPSPGQDPSIGGLKKWVSEMRAAFPDSRVEVIHTFTKDDMVLTHIRQTGTNTGPMMGTPATGKPFDMRGVDIIRFSNGKAVEHWGYFEELKMMMQL